MTTNELFALIRAQTQSLPADADVTGNLDAYVARARLDMRPDMLSFLTALGEMLSEWRKASPDSCGLRVRAGNQIVPLTQKAMASRFGNLPGVACLRLSRSLLETTLLATEEVARRTASDAAGRIRDILRARVGNLSLNEFFKNELTPGYNVIAGFIYVAVEKQAKPNQVSTRRLAWNSKEWLLQMATLSTGGFAGMRTEISGLDRDSIAWIKKHDPGLVMSGALLDQAMFRIVERGLPTEGLDMTEAAIARCARAVPTFTREHSAYRVNCPAVLVQVGNTDMISFALDWALSIIERNWSMVKF